MSTPFQYTYSVNQMSRQHTAPTAGRTDYQSENQRLKEALAQYQSEAQQLRERVAYLENAAGTLSNQYETSQRSLAEAQNRADNATNTWLVTRTWLDEAQTNLTTTQRDLADVRNELNQAKIERNQLQNALDDQTRAVTKAVNSERAARQEVANLNDRLCRITTRWATMVNRLQNETVGRQTAEQAVNEERERHRQTRETATRVTAEKVMLETSLQVTRDKLQQAHDQINKVGRPFPLSNEGTISSATSSASASPPPLTESDLSSSEPSQPSSPRVCFAPQPFSEVELDRMAAELESSLDVLDDDAQEIAVPSFPSYIRDPPVMAVYKSRLVDK